MSAKRIKHKVMSMAKRKAGGFRKARKKPWEDATLEELKSDPHCKEDVWMAPSFSVERLWHASEDGVCERHPDGSFFMWAGGERHRITSPPEGHPVVLIKDEIDPTEEHIRIVSKALNIPASSVDPKMAASICATAASLNDFGVTALRTGKKLMAEVAKAMHAAVNQFGTSIAEMEEQRRAREEEDDDDGTAEFSDGDELMEFFRKARHV